MEPLSIKVKRISLRTGLTIKLMDTQEHAFNPVSLKEDMQVVFQNKSDILQSSLEIEHDLEQIVLRYFFGQDLEQKDKREIFLNQILNASWCTFAAKLKLVKYLIKDLWIPKERERLPNAILKIIDIRNAFTHGKITIQSDGIVILDWFKEKNLTRNIDDQYIDELEEQIKDCREAVDKVSHCLNPSKSAHYTLMVRRHFRNDSFPVKFWLSLEREGFHIIPNRGKGGEVPVKSLDEFLNKVGETVKFLQDQGVWSNLSKEISKLSSEGYRHFVIGPDNKLADHY